MRGFRATAMAMGLLAAAGCAAGAELGETGAIVAAPPEARFASAFPLVADTRAFIVAEGDALWPGLASAPFGVVLVDSEGEILLCDERVPGGFTPAPRDLVPGCAAALGPSSWRKPTLLSAMPVFGPPSVVVMGTPEGTGLDASAWQMTLMHEHFHQWQSALPGYYDRVDALGLANGDETGMWMLNYPFPYADPEVARRFATASAALADALAAEGEGQAFLIARTEYVAARVALQMSVTPEQWRYFEFQLWQEGVARWTEITLALRHPDPAIRQAGERRRDAALTELRAPDLAKDGRVALYAYGFAEAALLERIDPAWRNAYPHTLQLGSLLLGE